MRRVPAFIRVIRTGVVTLGGLLGLLLVLGLGLSGCGDWRIELPGGNRRSRPNLQQGPEGMLTPQERQARACLQRNPDPDASLERFEQLVLEVRRRRPDLTARQISEATATTLADVVYLVSQFEAGVPYPPEEMALRAERLVRVLPGEPAQVARQLIERFQIDLSASCTRMGLGELERGFLLALDPYSTIQSSESVVVPLVSAYQQRGGGWLLAPLRGGEPPMPHIQDAKFEGVGALLTLRRWESDMTVSWRFLANRPNWASVRTVVVDLRSAAGTDLSFYQELLEFARASLSQGKTWILWTDSFTRGVPEAFAAELAVDARVLTVGERTAGHLRKGCEDSWALPGGDALKVRWSCELMHESFARLDGVGFRPEKELTWRVSSELSGVRRSTLGKISRLSSAVLASHDEETEGSSGARSVPNARMATEPQQTGVSRIPTLRLPRVNPFEARLRNRGGTGGLGGYPVRTPESSTLIDQVFQAILLDEWPVAAERWAAEVEPSPTN